MICSSCRRSFLTRLRSLQIQPAPSRASPSTATSSRRRYASTVPATPNAAPAQAPRSIAIDGGAANPAQSSNTAGLSQPLSELHTPSTSTAKKSGGDGAASPTKVKSSVPGGTELRGLGFTKAQPKVIAKEDDEYPDWLWTLLDRKNVASGETKADLSAMTKKQRARYDRKQERLLKDVKPAVPVHEQSKDITGPGDDAVVSLQRRQEITKSARAARRKNIRESNFLKSM